MTTVSHSRGDAPTVQDLENQVKLLTDKIRQRDQQIAELERELQSPRPGPSFRVYQMTTRRNPRIIDALERISDILNAEDESQLRPG
jgi:hypothetical protein